MAEARNELEKGDNPLDDRGTDARAGLEMLRRLRDEGFGGDDEKMSVALGRPIEEVTAWMNGGEQLDDDIIMKARGVAKERGIVIE